MSDLVERLRYTAKSAEAIAKREVGWRQNNHANLLSEAADEITRLRARIQEFDETLICKCALSGDIYLLNKGGHCEVCEGGEEFTVKLAVGAIRDVTQRAERAEARAKVLLEKALRPFANGLDAYYDKHQPDMLLLQTTTQLEDPSDAEFTLGGLRAANEALNEKPKSKG